MAMALKIRHTHGLVRLNILVLTFAVLRISGLQRNAMGLASGLNAFEAESVFKVSWRDSKLPLPKFGGSATDC
jgi:hypothetical protein